MHRRDFLQHARFGMFIRFGLYSTLGAEWKGKATGLVLAFSEEPRVGGAPT